MTPQSDCPRTDVLERMLAAELATHDRASLEEHLSDCRTCRHHLASRQAEREVESIAVAAVPEDLLARVRALPSTSSRAATEPTTESMAPVIRFWRRPAFVAAAAAAALVLAVFAGLQTPTEPDLDGHIWRDDGSELESIVLTLPDAGAPLALGQQTFRWAAAGTDTKYVFTLLDAGGDILLSKQTDDPELAVDLTALVSAGDRCYWFVEARLDDGVVLSSEVARLDIENGR